MRATIVGANVDLGKRSGAVNTNLEQIVTIEENGMKPVNFYVPTATEEQLKGAFKRVNEFTLKERVIDPVKRFGEKISEAFTSATEKISKFLTPENSVSEKLDSPERKDLESENHELDEEEQEVLNEFKTQLKGIEDEHIEEYKLPLLEGSDEGIVKEINQEFAAKYLGQKALKIEQLYNEFAEENPNLAQHMLSIISVAMKTGSGAAAGAVSGGPYGALVGALSGFGYGAASEVKGMVADEIVGVYIAEGVEMAVDKSAQVLMARYPSLEENEARAMAKVSLFAAILTSDAASDAKYVMKAGKVNSKISTGGINEGISARPNVDNKNARVISLFEKNRIQPKEGRIDYSDRFLGDISNFVEGTAKLHNGKLKEDLYLVNYHDFDKELGAGRDGRTLKWATHIAVGNKMMTIEDVHQHLALVDPDWGKRNAVTLIKIPAGTDVSFISGKAVEQKSLKTGKKFVGGGFQIRFLDFDEKWIAETKKIGGS